MDKDPFTNLMQIIKEEGLVDLPMNIRGKFAQAIRDERLNGATTPLAELLFAEALELEAATVSG
jgi:hypothetical protein